MKDSIVYHDPTDYETLIHPHRNLTRCIWLSPLMGLDYDANKPGVEVDDPAKANLISSWTKDNLQSPVLDIDGPVRIHQGFIRRAVEVEVFGKWKPLDFPPGRIRIVRSKTPGHHHVYVDTKMDHGLYMEYLRHLWRQGILGQGFAQVSQKRGMTCVRIRPWEKDTQSELVAMVMLGYKQTEEGLWTRDETKLRHFYS